MSPTNLLTMVWLRNYRTAHSQGIVLAFYFQKEIE